MQKPPVISQEVIGIVKLAKGKINDAVPMLVLIKVLTSGSVIGLIARSFDGLRKHAHRKKHRLRELIVSPDYGGQCRTRTCDLLLVRQAL
jgi:hypothetical protein